MSPCSTVVETRSPAKGGIPVVNPANNLDWEALSSFRRSLPTTPRERKAVLPHKVARHSANLPSCHQGLLEALEDSSSS
jgi:hypothetical protein